MNQICRDIFRAIHEGKWLKIEYRNKADQVTKYWIGIRDLDPRSRTMKVDGLHLGQFTIGEYDRIFIDSILSTEIIEGTYCPENNPQIKAHRPIQYIFLVVLALLLLGKQPVFPAVYLPEAYDSALYR